jgi:hypothetical protein
MWYNLSLIGFNFLLSYLYKLEVYTESVTVPLNLQKISLMRWETCLILFQTKKDFFKFQ